MKQVNFGVVGLGDLGELHIKHLKYKIEGANLIAVCARHESRVKEIQERYNVKYAYTDFNEMIKNTDIEAVMIVSNVDAHKGQCIAAAKAGKHIFCEKPLARTVEECHEIEEAVEANKGKVFTIGYMRRSDPSYVDAMKKVKAGAIGEPILFKSVSLDPSSVLEAHLEGVNAGKYSPFFLEMGIHDIDLALWYMQSEIESVYAVGGAYVESRFANYNDYDNACALARLKNGKCFYLQVGRTHNSSHVYSEIVGTNGTIRINNIPRKNRLEIFNDSGVIEECESTFLERWVDAFIAEVESFIDCVVNGKEPVINVYEGAKSLKMYNMIQTSFVEDRLVRSNEFEIVN